MTSANLEAALDYARQGRSVIPVAPASQGGKKALVEWKRHQTQRATEQEIRGWWGQFPDANVGIVTGVVSGLVVLDADGPEGRVSLIEALGSMPETPTAKTGKGLHVCLQHPGVDVITKARLRPGLDIRGDGGYIVAPPSLHENGERYEWLTSLDHPLAEMPSFLTTEWVPLNGARNPEGWEQPLLGGVRTGSRNHDLTKLVGSWFAKGLGQTEVMDLALAWAAKCPEPFPGDEALTIVESIWSRERAKRERAPAERRDSHLMTLSDVQARFGSGTDWLVDKLLAVGDMSVLVAKPGVGKSTFAAQLAFSVAHGAPFLGRQCRKGTVVYMAFEGARKTFAQIVRLGYDPSSRDILAWVREAGHQENPAEWLSGVLRGLVPDLIIVDTLTDLIRIKHGASNAGYQETTEKLGQLYDWAQQNRSHIALLHHSGKGDREGIDAALGSIGIVSKPGTVLDYRSLSKAEGAPRVFRGVKHREGLDVNEEIPPVVLDFHPDGGLTVAGTKEDIAIREIGTEIIRLVVQTPGTLQEELEDEVEGRAAAKKEALRRLTHPETGVLVREGTPKSRTFPLRLRVRADLVADPVEVWRQRIDLVPKSPLGSQTSGTNSNPVKTSTSPLGSHPIVNVGSQLNENEPPTRLGSHAY